MVVGGCIYLYHIGSGGAGGDLYLGAFGQPDWHCAGRNVSFSQPVFGGVAFAALLLGEQLRATDFIGVLVIAAGILAVQMSQVIEIRKMRSNFRTKN